MKAQTVRVAREFLGHSEEKGEGISTAVSDK
jgi:hypothetical protein